MFQVRSAAQVIECVLDCFSDAHGELVLRALGAAYRSLASFEQMRLELLWNSSLLHSSIFTLF
jgi:hypothetical protein